MEKEITLKYLLQILKKYIAAIIIVSVLLSAATGIVITLTSKPTYSSSAKVLINYSYGDNVLTPSGQMNELNYILAIMPTVIETLESNDFLEIVNEQAGLKYSNGEMKSFISYHYTDDSKIISITVKTPNKEHTKKICEALATVIPPFIEDLNFGHFDFFENFKTPTRNNTSALNTCLLVFAFSAVGVYAVAFIITEINNKRVNENTDLPHRYQLPIIGKIPDFNTNDSHKNKKEGGYYEEAKY